MVKHKLIKQLEDFFFFFFKQRSVLRLKFQLPLRLKCLVVAGLSGMLERTEGGGGAMWVSQTSPLLKNTGYSWK